MVCLDGMPSTAALMVLGELAAAGSAVVYHGDFDWRGLAIAGVLARKVPVAEPWRFSAVDYQCAVDRGLGAVPLTGKASVSPWDDQARADHGRGGCRHLRGAGGSRSSRRPLLIYPDTIGSRRKQHLLRCGNTPELAPRHNSVTSNRDPSEFLAVMADPLIAQSAVDRLQGAAYELIVEGQSYRKRQRPTVAETPAENPAPRRRQRPTD